MWLDKYIEEQAEQVELMNQIAAPYEPAELVEMIEQDER